MAIKTLTLDGKIAKRINICENPSFENNITDYWSTFGTGTATKSRDTVEKKYGSASFKINANGINTDGGIEKNFTLPAGTWYLSGWIKTENITGDAKLVLRRTTDFAAIINLTVSNSPATRDWTRVSGTVTTVTDLPCTLLMGLGPYGAPSQGIAWFDGILLEKEADLVDYYDGSLANSEWQGTAHNSKSTYFGVKNQSFTVDGVVFYGKTFTADGKIANRVNLVKNPSFEKSITDSWNNFTSSGSVTRTRDTDIKVRGDASIKIVAAIASDAGVEATITLPAGTYQFSGYMKTGVMTQGDAKLVIRQNTDFAALVNFTETGSNVDWTRKSGEFTLAVATEVTFLMGIGPYGTPGIGTVYFDQIMLEKAEDDNGYFDGNYPDAIFTGADNNSYSALFASAVDTDQYYNYENRATGGTVTSSNPSDNGAGENMDKAFDGLVTTKWNANSSTPWIKYDFGSARMIVGYKITSANDTPSRDPSAWTLEGSNDDSTWVTLDTRTGQSFNARYSENVYQFANNVAYRYIRLTITANNGATNQMQIGDIEYYSKDVLRMRANFGGAGRGSNEAGSSNVEMPKAGFDRDASATKWNEAKNGSNPFWLRYDFGERTRWKINHYKITTANDNEGRDPKTWKLQGSNTGAFAGEEVDLDTITNGDLPATRLRTEIFYCDNPQTIGYRYIRLYITDLKDLAGSSSVQIEELALFGTPVFSTAFTVDGIVKASQTITYTADGIVKQVVTTTFTADGVVLAKTTKTFTADGIVKQVVTTTFTADGIVKASQTTTYTVDGVIKEVVTKTFTADGIVKESRTITFTADGIVKESFTETFTADGIVKVATPITFTADGIVLVHTLTQFTADGVVKEILTTTFTTDGIVRAAQLKTFTVDGVVKQLQTQTFTADGVVKSVETATFTTDGIIKEVLTKTFSADGVIKEVITKQFTADGVVKEVLTRTFTVDGRIQAGTLITYTADGIIVDRMTITFTADGVISPVKFQSPGGHVKNKWQGLYKDRENTEIGNQRAPSIYDRQDTPVLAKIKKKGGIFE